MSEYRDLMKSLMQPEQRSPYADVMDSLMPKDTPEAAPSALAPQQPSAPKQSLADMPLGDYLAHSARTSLPGAALQGIVDTWDAGAQMLSRLGGPSEAAKVDAMVKDRGQSYADARDTMGKSGIDIGRALGPVMLTGGLPLPGAAPTLMGRMGQGSVLGAVSNLFQPATEGGDFWSQKGKQAMIGAATGAVAAPVAEGAAKVVEGVTRPAVQLLRSEGVTPTPGQILGGWAKAAEEKLSSIPIFGGIVKKGQDRATKELNTAALNRALAPLNEELPKTVDVGRDAVGYVRTRLGGAYDQVLDKIGAAPVDPLLGQRLSQVAGMVSNLPKERGDQFVRILKNEIVDRIDNGTLTGEAIKKAESNIGGMAFQYLKSVDADQRTIGAALLQSQNELRDWLARVSPQNATQLQAINSGWANFLRAQRAAGSIGADQGVFSAAQLQNAVRALDSSRNKGKFAEGNALMQDLADAAKSTLTNRVPNSGTADRTLAALGSTMALTSPATAIAAGAPLAGALALPAFGYTPWGQRLVANLLASRPPQAALFAAGLRDASPLLGVGAAPLVTLP